MKFAKKLKVGRAIARRGAKATVAQLAQGRSIGVFCGRNLQKAQGQDRTRHKEFAGDAVLAYGVCRQGSCRRPSRGAERTSSMRSTTRKVPQSDSATASIG